MSITLTSTINLKISLNQVDSQSYNRYVDFAALNFVSGLNNSSANLLWHDQRTIPSTGEQLDLFTLPRSIFSGSYNVNLSGAAIRGIFILNTTTGEGRDIAIHGNGANGFSYPFGGSTGVMIKDQTPGNYINLRNDWVCSTSKRYLDIIDVQGTGGTSYLVGIIGSL